MLNVLLGPSNTFKSALNNVFFFKKKKNLINCYFHFTFISYNFFFYNIIILFFKKKNSQDVSLKKSLNLNHNCLKNTVHDAGYMVVIYRFSDVSSHNLDYFKRVRK